jgi:glycine/D-amino acid oxidase-like deaminating enzyme
MRVLICGGGVIAASIAYFLSRRGAEVVVVERNGLACAASGKSGGFLALDWCDGIPLEQLARRSFALHASLHDELGGGWGYRRLTTYGGAAGSEPARAGSRPHGVDWISDRVRLERRLGSPETTAQVHPRAFTAAMMRAAEAYGATLHHGEVTGLIGREEGAIRGVEVERDVLEGDAVVIAMGPWSILAAAWLPMPGVFGLKGHSIVFDTGTHVSPDALFLDYPQSSGTMLSPEVFPRDDGTTYVCGLSSQSALPLDPADVAPDPGAIERLQAMCGDLSPELHAGCIRATQACFRPVTADGLPLIGRHTRPPWRLRCHRPQRLGHPQRARYGRGDGRADLRWQRPHRGHRCL